MKNPTAVAMFDVVVDHLQKVLFTVRLKMCSDLVNKGTHCVIEFNEGRRSNEDTFAHHRQPHGPRCVQFLMLGQEFAKAWFLKQILADLT